MEEPMKLLLSLAVLVLASGTLIGQENDRPQAPPTPAASQKRSFTTQALKKENSSISLRNGWMQLFAGRMKSESARLMAAEFTLQIWDASRAPQPLALWLDTLKNRLNKIEFKYSGLNARVFGDVAVVYSRFWWKGTLDDKPFTDSGFLADVWVKRNGKWQVVARRSPLSNRFRMFLSLARNKSGGS